jgi:hypothetical protein
MATGGTTRGIASSSGDPTAGPASDPLPAAGRLAREHLRLAERLKELLVGPALGAGPLGRRLEAIQDPGCLQRPQPEGQPLRRSGRSSCRRAGTAPDAPAPASPLGCPAWQFSLQTRNFPARDDIDRHSGKRTSCSESSGPPPGAAGPERRGAARDARRRPARAHLRRAGPQAGAADPARPARGQRRERTAQVGAHRRTSRPSARPAARPRLPGLRERARDALRARFRRYSSGSGRFSPGHAPVR